MKNILVLLLLAFSVPMCSQGNSLDFDGIDDRVNISQIPALGNTFTFEYWVNYHGGDNTYDRVVSTSNWQIELSTGGNDMDDVRFWYKGINSQDQCGWTSTNYDIPINTWVHLAWVNDGGGIKFYVDGQLFYSNNSCNAVLGSFDLALGANQISNSEAGNFTLDEFRIWNTARSQEEIEANMNYELIGNEVGLIAYYPFDQGIAGGSNISETTLLDATSNANNGTLAEFTLSGDTSNWISSTAPLQFQPFVTTWKTDNPGVTNNTSIRIPTASSEYTYNYDVDWDNDGVFDEFGLTGDVVHDFGAAGTYTIGIQGDFPSIRMTYNSDSEKLLTVEQWGNIIWKDMKNAFYRATNLVINATDSPDLSNVTDMSNMFYLASAFNQDINNWDVSNVTNMSRMFYRASSFNQPLNNWDVSNVTDLAYMFSGASSFNQPLDNWDVSNVTDMSRMFRNASSFNQPLDNWNVSNVTDLRFMFSGASSFNQPLDNWNVSNITDLAGMFSGAISFNRPLSNWDVSNVTLMSYMFQNASSFDQNLGSWSITSLTNANNMLSGAGLTTNSYDSILIGWNGQGVANIVLGVDGLEYCNGESARNELINTYGWNITGDNLDCSGLVGCLPNGIEFEYQSEIDNFSSNYPGCAVIQGGVRIDPAVTGGITDLNGLSQINEIQGYLHIENGVGITSLSGLHNLETIGGDFETFGGGVSNNTLVNFTGLDSLKTIGGDLRLQGYWNAISSLQGLDNLEEIGDDLLVRLEALTDISALSNLDTIHGNLKINWNDVLPNLQGLENITTVGGYLEITINPLLLNVDGLSSLESIGGKLFIRNNSNLEDLDGLSGLTSIGDELEVSLVTNLTSISGLSNLTSINGRIDISDTGLSSLTGLDSIDHTGITNLIIENNPSLSQCDVESICEYLGIPQNTTSINNNATGCSDRDVIEQACTAANSSCYDLIQNGDEQGIDCGGTYCPPCDNSFVTTWQTTSNNESITIPTTGGGYNYSVDWGDGSMDTLITGNISHSYAVPGVYTVSIQGDFPRIYFNNTGSKLKIIEINQWGADQWTSMARAFYGCTNLGGQAIDEPDLSLVTDMSYMFYNCSSFNQAIGNWNTSNVDNMRNMFYGASSFDQYIGGWNVDNVLNMREMFYNATSFNQDIGSWNVGNVTSFTFTFYQATSFNQDIGNWNTGSGTHFTNMFEGAIHFDQNLTGWDVSSAVNMTDMFKGVALSSSNYDSLLLGWSSQNLQNGVNFSGGNSYYCAGDSAKTDMMDNSSWNIIDGGKNCPDGLDPFVTTWETTATNEIIHIRTTGSGFHYNVDWGDSTTTYAHTGNSSHIYSQPGIYTVKIYGDFPWMYFNNTGSKEKILSVDQWGTGKWKSMARSFYGCSNVAGQASDTPDLSEVTDMTGIFKDAHAWNQDMSDWDVSNVQIMREAFSNANSFNQDVGGWNTSNVINVREMFYNASSFNQDIGSWDVGQVTNFELSFYGASSFNQDIGNWNTGNGTHFFSMFEEAIDFDQDIGGWDMQAAFSMADMFKGVQLSNENYDALLIGWNSQILREGATFSGGNSQYCLGDSAKLNMVENLSWNIIDGGRNCPDGLDPFVTKWETTSTNEIIFIRTTGSGYHYNVHWGDGNISYAHTGNTSHTYADPGIYTVKIYGDFPWMYFNNTGSKEKILSVDQWGTGKWKSMARSFYGCSNLAGQASDAPDLSEVTDINSAFREAHAWNQDMSTWDVSNVQDMRYLFYEANSFNQNIGTWNTSNVVNMREMFYNANSFNQYIGAWNVGNVANLALMFSGASSFNQDIGSWNTGSGTSFFEMFEGAVSFDQNIANWDVSNASTMSDMFKGVALSSSNYDSLLIGWSTQNLQSGVNFSGGNSQYCAGDSAKINMMANSSWNIIDGGRNCPDGLDPFVTTWQTTSSNESIVISTTGGGYHYNVHWGDGNITYAHTGNTSHTYADPGIYTVKIYGDFPWMYFNNTGSKEKILSIDQWGTGKWKSMARSFYGCSNLAGQASDAPDLSEVTDINSAFRDAHSWNQDMSSWDVSNVQDMRYLFYDANSFNQAIGSWNTENVVNMREMFYNATSFNQDIGNWNIGNVANLALMFSGASSFNQDIGSWNTGSGTSFFEMFDGAVSFDQNIANWDVSNASTMSDMFKGVALSSSNFDSLLIGWSTQNLQSGVNFSGGNSQYCLGDSAKIDMIENSSWSIIDGGRNCPDGLDPFITTWQTTSTNETIFIGTSGSGYHYNVDWGDGSKSYAHTGNSSHVYSVPGIHTVKIYGDFPWIHFNNTGSKEKILSVDQWGTGRWKSMARAFYGCSNLAGQASDAPDLSEVTDMNSMFRDAHSWNQDMSSWDVSNVQDMRYLFYDANSFNQAIGSWNTGNVVNMREMFYNATAFNQDIGNWNTGLVNNFIFTFAETPNFNQDLGGWDISSITSMTGMLDNSGLCINNYELTLEGWANQGVTSISLGSTNIKYCDPTDRNILTNTLGWNISGDLFDCSETNTWIGPSTGNWHDNVNNWSQGHFPTPCETTMIPPNVTLNFGLTDTAIIWGLTISSGSSLNVPIGAMINVKND